MLTNLLEIFTIVYFKTSDNLKNGGRGGSVVTMVCHTEPKWKDPGFTSWGLSLHTGHMQILPVIQTASPLLPFYNHCPILQEQSINSLSKIDPNNISGPIYSGQSCHYPIQISSSVPSLWIWADISDCPSEGTIYKLIYWVFRRVKAHFCIKTICHDFTDNTLIMSEV